MKNVDLNTFPTVLAIVAAIGALASLLFMVRKVLISSIKPNIRLDTDFFEQLDKKFDLGLVRSKEDITILADSFRREHAATYSLKRILEDYLRYLINKAADSDVETKSTFIDGHEKVNQILRIENEEKPFNELPLEEGRIFRMINLAIKSEKNDEVLSALEDLRIVISAKNKIYQQSDTLNRLSIPLAIIGLILTVYFGIKSLPNEQTEGNVKIVRKEKVAHSMKMDSVSNKK